MGVALGRTMGEAEARALGDPHFAGGQLRDSGLFGTFEDCQEQVLDLARAGVDVIRADVASARDIADLLAQLVAVVTGATPKLYSDSLDGLGAGVGAAKVIGTQRLD
jgi:hypothetical protein